MSYPALPLSFLAQPIAHRALHGPGAPENSRAAIRAAVEHGFGIEIDLQLSADGVAMVFHDGGLARLTDATGPVRDRSSEELATIPLKGGDEGIPTFADVLALVNGQVPLLVELKDQTGDLGESDGALETATLRDLQGYTGPLAVMSFNPSMVGRMVDLAGDIPHGLVTCDFAAADWPGLPAERREQLARMEGLDDLGVSFISHSFRDLQNPRVADVKQGGRVVLCWTIRSAEEESEARKIAQNVTFEGYLPVRGA